MNRLYVMFGIAPDGWWRLRGTTYPTDRAPEGSMPLRSRLPRFLDWIGASLINDWSVVRPQKGDVLVCRVPDPKAVDPDVVAEANRLVRQAGMSAAVFLPLDCRVHVEEARLRTEDRGYRETKTYGEDRGVHVGVPGAVPK